MGHTPRPLVVGVAGGVGDHEVLRKHGQGLHGGQCAGVVLGEIELIPRFIAVYNVGIRGFERVGLAVFHGNDRTVVGIVQGH